MKKHLLIVFLTLCCAAGAIAKDDSENFDFMLVLTQQNADLDWWTAVPAQFGPKLTTIGNVTKGEYFKILCIFNNYGVSDKGFVDVTYDLVIKKPDNSTYEEIKDCTGYKGPSTGPHLMPSTGIPVVCFEPEDEFGKYSIEVTATDHIKNTSISKEEEIELHTFVMPTITSNDWESLFFEYPTRPQPAKVLAAFLQPPRPYLDEDGHPLWSVLWFDKHVFSDNEFLCHHAVDYFSNKATEQQKKDIFLLFHLIGKQNLLPKDGMKQYRLNLETLVAPDPYSEITTGDQLDMLWAEFFATSRIKPVRQIITAFNLSRYAGTLKKIKAGELNAKATEVREKAMLDAVLQSAVWSIGSNCKQSPLLFQYCVGLYESEELNKTEKAYLGIILKKVSEDAKE